MSRNTVEELVVSLNQLLNSLDLPFVIQTPTDLTPSLLLAILASLLHTPIPTDSVAIASLDDTITTLNALSQTHDALPTFKIKQMKFLLGVLENDVLHMDVGLSNIDPRRLAKGEWEEVEFVGELFVWLGKRVGHIPGGSSDPNIASLTGTNIDLHSRRLGVKNGEDRESLRKLASKANRPVSPSYTTITDDSVNPTNLSIHSFTPSINADTITSLPSTSASVSTAISSRSLKYADIGTANASATNTIRARGHNTDANPIDSATTTPILHPRCIHELEIDLTGIASHPLWAHSQQLSSIPPAALHPTSPCEITTCQCSFSPRPHPRPKTPTNRSTDTPDELVQGKPSPESSIRYEGYISQVDEESELSWFEASRNSTSFSLAGADMSNTVPGVTDFESLLRDCSPRRQRIGGREHETSPPFNFARRLKSLEERARLLGEIALAHNHAEV